MRLENKTAIVAGTGRGLGKEIALRSAAEGVKVIVVGMSMETVTATADEISASGGTAKVFVVNIVKQDEVKAMTDLTVEFFGTLDVIVNNIGINRDTMLHKMIAEQWDRVIVVNLTDTFYYVQYTAQIMREKRSGAIINISPASQPGSIGQADHAVSRAGVVDLTKIACRKLVRRGVTCSAVCSSFIDTDTVRGAPEKIWDTMISKIPIGRAGSPVDVANMVIFLASDETDYMTGEAINVGGGMIL